MSETATQPTGPTNVEDVEEAMRDVVDPELGINVVDLGLLYDIRVEDKTAILDMPIDDAPGHALHKVPVRNVIEILR